MKAKSIKGKSTEEIQSGLRESMADGFKPTIAIVFISVKQDREAISGLLEEKGIQIFGATTAGEFIDGEMEGGSIVMLLLDMNPAYFKLEFLETSQDTAFEDAIKLGNTGKETFTNPAFIIANSGVTLDGEPFVEGIIQGFGKHPSSEDGEVTIFGGKAGDDMALESTFVFTNGKSSDCALIALLIDESKIDVNGIATCGWQAIGTSKTVTKSEGSIVYTIDDKPALDMLMNYLGVEIKPDGKREIVTFLSSWYYPLQVEREKTDPVIRTAMFANSEERSLICSGKVPQGSKIKFSMPPDFDSIDTVVQECRSIKDEAQQADALIMFSCVSRYLSFGVVMKEEIEQVQKIWDAPMAGFFSYGEYGKSKTGKYDYHNNTCCLVTLKEK
ncbi:MAG TPA: FIST N-terminal domain-containing protein [Chitinophagaceae bacterium]|nr:FIST N-terminal domain-containing protein [Chitinophagaceae bacterium]HQV85873.1 FIST N-terminal domain-containing protein [Chitinophagaceae bacterium]HQZ75212.1 FIST N-terminal domain-containing protein [Chitinophagaceae bacterium]